MKRNGIGLYSYLKNEFYLGNFTENNRTGIGVYILKTVTFYMENGKTEKSMAKQYIIMQTVISLNLIYMKMEQKNKSFLLMNLLTLKATGIIHQFT